jgi:hypothetical protein
MPLADEVERIAQVKAVDRAARSLQRAVLAEREDEARPVQAILQARGDDADDAFVERRIEDRERGLDRAAQREGAVDLRLGVLAHRRLERAPLAVDGVEHRRELVRARGVVAEQALDAERHVGQRPAAFRRGPIAKPKSAALAWRGSRPATANSAATPGCMRPARIRFSPCATRQRLLRSRRTTSATVPSATRSSKASSRGCAAQGELAALAQLGAKREQDIEGDADAGEVLAREGAARLVRIDDHVGGRQDDAAVALHRQVVVGDDDREPRRLRVGDAVEAGDAVVDGHQHVGALGEDEVDDLRRQPVAVDAPVGDDVRQRRRVGAEQAQAAQRDGAGGRAVAVVVGDDADAAAGADRIGEQDGGVVRAEQAGGRQQARQRVVELVGRRARRAPRTGAPAADARPPARAPTRCAAARRG